MLISPGDSINAKEKADVVEYSVFHHVGLLGNGPSSFSGVPFI